MKTTTTTTTTKKAILIKETHGDKTFHSLYCEDENFDLLQIGKKWDLIMYAIQNDIEITNLTR